MSGSVPTHPAFYRPAAVAAMLHCSVWWVKEQARRRRVPYCWIGGSYLFTAEHVAEIVRRFERRPVEDDTPGTVPTRRPAASGDGTAPVRLRSRTPRRARSTGTSQSAA